MNSPFTCHFCGDAVYAKVWLFIYLCRERDTARSSPNSYREERELSLKSLRTFVFSRKSRVVALVAGS